MIRKGTSAGKVRRRAVQRVGSERLPIKVLYGPSVARNAAIARFPERFVVRQSIRAREELTRRIFRELGQALMARDETIKAIADRWRNAHAWQIQRGVSGVGASLTKPNQGADLPQKRSGRLKSAARRRPLATPLQGVG